MFKLDKETNLKHTTFHIGKNGPMILVNISVITDAFYPSSHFVYLC